jgi:hypothetical protein
LAGILCPPRRELAARKRKSSAATGAASLPRKTSGKRGHGRRSSRSMGQTSAQELTLAKPMKPSKKFVVKDGAAGKKTLSTSVGGSGMTHDSKHALKLFGSDSPAFDDETAPPERLRKHSKEAPLAKDVPKSSSLKGIFG